MTSAPPSLHHLAVVVRDPEASLAFYGGLLGLGEIRRWHDARGLRSIWVKLGGEAFLAIERAETTGPTRAEEAPGFHCLALAIARSERAWWQEKLACAGFPLARETPYTIYVRDPDGHLVGLSHYPDPIDPP
jgi:hypothetical protein